jgi:hypothetical protein
MLMWVTRVDLESNPGPPEMTGAQSSELRHSDMSEKSYNQHISFSAVPYFRSSNILQLNKYDVICYLRDGSN